MVDANCSWHSRNCLPQVINDEFGRTAFDGASSEKMALYCMTMSNKCSRWISVNLCMAITVSEWYPHRTEH
eukprot:scaffold16721_cov39-Prasinocladus_malaysianus.AAC.2